MYEGGGSILYDAKHPLKICRPTYENIGKISPSNAMNDSLLIILGGGISYQKYFLLGTTFKWTNNVFILGFVDAA